MGQMKIDKNLPGADLVEQGILDLQAKKQTSSALLVATAAPRLRGLGFRLPAYIKEINRPEMRLYRLLWEAEPRGAHSRYNALIRRVVSFSRAFEAVMDLD